MSQPETKSTPTTVLVVDDEGGIRQARDRFLTRLGYRVVQAASGAEALERQAADRTPHVEARREISMDVALNALGAAKGWDAETEAVRQLAKELGLEPDEVVKDVRKRRR